ncbi:MAG: GTPase HflX [Acidobacteria bacterium]|nr:GTPase HflX [Acidobacteriota bacterium]
MRRARGGGREPRRPDAPRAPGRRVTELPPELQALRLERVVLVGLAVGSGEVTAEESVAELGRLAGTAGAAVAATLVQRREKPDPATFLGRGKAEEVRGAVKACDADTVVVDEELSPAQLRNLEEICGCKVIDRTALILDIFAQHAHSAEGKRQVELAQLAYLLPRLRGWGESLSRLGGGIGTRGPGETKIEVDRRRIRKRIAKLRIEIKDLERTRGAKRRARVRSRVPSVALVGYTNAGKSTLLNRLTGAGVEVEDRLFSTLDPTTRRLELPDGRACVVTDTVGFVRKLPHTLVEAFKSTLEEVVRADLILHVVDGSAEEPDLQAAAVREVLGEIGAAEIGEIVAVNKADLADAAGRARLRRLFPGGSVVSGLTGEGVDRLVEEMAGRIPRPEVEAGLLVPYARGDVVASLHAAGAVLSEEYVTGGVRVLARLREDQLARLAAFLVAGPAEES